MTSPMHSLRLAVFLLIVNGLFAGCSGEPGPTGTDGGQDVGTSDATDVSLEDVSVDGGDVVDEADQTSDAATDEVLPAEDYCETIVDFFCPYYLRCGRTAAADLESCRTTFLETCNEVYEPRYAAFVEDGFLELSSRGVARCRAHLEDVPCEQQMFDLDGGCADVWRGLVGAGGECGPGIGSFVCDENSSCTIGTDLCGTCEATAAVGEDCTADDVTCATGVRCLDGTCVTRALPGEACGATKPCVVAATCVDGVCDGFDVVAVGDACDGGKRCPYNSTCLDGVCVGDALIGESCTDRNCASGWCDQTICRPLLPEGESCAGNTQCLSGVCDEQVCQALPGGCFL